MDANPVRTAASATALLDVSPAQMRAARGLLGWSAQELAEQAGVDLLMLVAFESDGYFLSIFEFARLQRALISSGVEFIALGDGLGRGVRFVASGAIKPELTRGALVRAARGLLGWRLPELATTARVELAHLVRFERAESRLSPAETARIDCCLEATGILFVGHGIRLRTPPHGCSLSLEGPPQPKRPWA